MPALEPLVRIGHKGADAIVPGNTIASFEAALEAGVDMIEFDVLCERPDGGGPIVCVHDYKTLARADGAVPSYAEALEWFAAHPQVRVHVDVKRPGYERTVVAGLREHGLMERAIVSTPHRSCLAAIAALEPDLRRGWTVPLIRRDPFRSVHTAVPAWILLQWLRLRMPSHAAAAIRSGEVHALFPHWRLVTGRLVRAVRDAGGETYVWTVDDAARIRALEGLGVTGVITNDPRLFAT